MRRRAEYERIRALISAGVNDCAIARATGVPRGTVKEWRSRTTAPGDGPWGSRSDHGCPRCGEGPLDESSYAYLLGLYLGDGYLARHHRGVYSLRVTLDSRYPGIIDECAEAMDTVAAHRWVGRQARKGCVVVLASWKHWPCLFPQHGPGKKYRRTIRLAEWQEVILRRHPGGLLRGLIHSDGCRFMNTVNGKPYPRYQFSNKSADIHDVFQRACAALGIRCTFPRPDTASVARRNDVALLDGWVGVKR